MLTPHTFAAVCAIRRQLRAAPPEQDLRALARAQDLSVGQVIRVYRRLFGQTPHQQRTQWRLAQARGLLAEGRLSVTEVCLEVGFESLGSFSGLFARYYGEPPSQCRRRFHALGGLPGTSRARLTPGCLSLMGRAWAARATSEKQALSGPTRLIAPFATETLP